MRSRLIVGSLFVIGALGFSAAGVATQPAIKWAAVNLKDTTVIAGKFIYGPVIFIHDDARMARGEPCTTVHRFDAAKGGVGDELVGFHCTPRWGKAPKTFVQSTTRKHDGPPVMTEYQFAGDEESHLIPEK
jgi:hypothetical protein